jgi:hypothetical protein
MENIIGTCSECGGPVAVPSMMVDPVPRCKRCGATTASPYGPIIKMVPTKPPREVCDSYFRPDRVFGGPCLNCGCSQPEHIIRSAK